MREDRGEWGRNQGQGRWLMADGRWLMDATALPYPKNFSAEMLVRFGNNAYLCSAKMIVRYEKMPPPMVAFVVSAIEIYEPIRAVIASGNGNVPVACTISHSNAQCCPIFFAKRIERMPRGRRRADEELASKAALYDDLKVFRTKEKAIYDTICRRGLLDKLCGHMKRIETKTPEEKLAEIASRYNNLKEFTQREPSALCVIRERGLFDKLCGHMKRSIRKGFTKEELVELASGYEEVGLFKEENESAYNAILRLGLKEELLGHMKRKRREKIPEDELAARAAKYDNLKEFQKKDPRAYHAIRSRGLGEKLCAHMTRACRLNTPDEELAEIASRYDDYTEFREKEGATYNLINRRGLTKKLCGHMKRKRRKRMSVDDLAEITSKYNVLKEFYDKERPTYDIIHKRGLINKLCAHMKREERTVISDEELAAIASKYDVLQEFYEKEGYVYKEIRKRRLFNKMCGHMKRAGNLFRRKIYVFTFSDGYAYVGLTQNPDYRYWQHTNPLRRSSPVYKHIKETGIEPDFKIITDWLDVNIVGEIEDDYIKQYAADGWKMLNREGGGGLGAIARLFTGKRIMEEVAKYEYVEDLMKGSPNFWRYIRRHHLFDQYCSQMKRRNNPK